MKKILGVVILLLALSGSAAAQAHTVALSWTASTDAAANPSLTYNIYRANVPCASATTFTKVNSSAIAAVTFTDSGLQPGSYCYQGTALLNGVESLASNQAPAVILPKAQTSLVAVPN